MEDEEGGIGQMKGRSAEVGEAYAGGNWGESGRAREGEGGGERREGEGKASRLNFGGNGSLKFSVCGSLNYFGTQRFKRRGPGRDGVNMGGRSGHASPDASCIQKRLCAERVNSQVDLGCLLPVHLKLQRTASTSISCPNGSAYRTRGTHSRCSTRR